jgi:hypothetical protein
MPGRTSGCAGRKYTLEGPGPSSIIEGELLLEEDGDDAKLVAREELALECT